MDNRTWTRMVYLVQVPYEDLMVEVVQAIRFNASLWLPVVLVGTEDLGLREDDGQAGITTEFGSASAECRWVMFSPYRCLAQALVGTEPRDVGQRAAGPCRVDGEAYSSSVLHIPTDLRFPAELMVYENGKN